MCGKLIVIDGLDGSGKATQTEILEKRLKDNGFKVAKVSFPNYESQSSAAVKMYLNGEVGTIDEVNVYAASSFYAIDRYISFATNWGKLYNEGYIILCDRYTTSNICHQMSKLGVDERDAYMKWLYDYEFGLLKIPQPDAVIYLDMLPQTSQKLMEYRYNGVESKKDLHESNLKYLENCRTCALAGAEKLKWHIIRCDEDGMPQDKLKISDIIFSYISSIGILEDLC